jgi:hypothetical protein
MDFTKARSRDCLSVRNADENKQIMCVLIDNEAACLPADFNAEIQSCHCHCNDHLAVATDDVESKDFAGRLEIAAAMGKKIHFLHATLNDHEFSRIRALIAADALDWPSQLPHAKRWIVYPYRCDFQKPKNSESIQLFNASLI